MKTKICSHSGFLSSRGSTAFFLCAASACTMLAGTLLAFLPVEVGTKASHPAAAGLTFAERVAHQRAIEEVYWRHRIWPKENPNLKPPLDAVMSQAQIEEKVADYLRKSQALEDYWQQPITTEQLQAETNRMAQHTKQPEVLRELFEALGNDPFVIAECLARPVLAERLIADLSAQGKTRPPQSAPTNAEFKRRADWKPPLLVTRRLFGMSPSAFGHPGAGGSHAFADPENRISFAYVMNQMEQSLLPNEKSLGLIDAIYG
jgi:hypothetical protein